jgi:type I site-specific restriction-modification system R (restriction) subunit
VIQPRAIEAIISMAFPVINRLIHTWVHVIEVVGKAVTVQVGQRHGIVFVDKCHGTQSGKRHRVKKAMMPNAVFIRFTGTPLLKKDEATSVEVFGWYIHTYKFSEAVEVEVVLDLVYEA